MKYMINRDQIVHVAIWTKCIVKAWELGKKGTSKENTMKKIGHLYSKLVKEAIADMKKDTPLN